MKIELDNVAPAAIEADLLVVFAIDQNASNDKNAAPMIELLTTNDDVKQAGSSVISSGEFKAKSNEILLLHAPQGLKADRLLIAGLGSSGKASVHDLRRAVGAAVRFAKPRGIRSLTVLSPLNFDVLQTFRAIAEGAILADFDSDSYRTDRNDQSVESLCILVSGHDVKAAEAGMMEGIVVAESQNFARSLINEPSNRMTPTILGQKAEEMALSTGLKCDVYGAEKLHELKMGAFLSVAQGSDEPPALIVMTYEPEDTPTGNTVLGLVGKGITFDTGGISLKPADNMEKMKYDMAGGAAMIGAMRAIALLKPKVRVIAIICAAENMPSGTAQKPGDVQTAMSGKTIEIINTDAEGRLVLADGLTYARQLGATHLIDAATLTGAISVALGKSTAGVFSNDDPTYNKFAAALQASGEKFWRMPLGEEYTDLIKSDIGDIKNTGGRYGGASTAAEFLHAFAEDTPWLHLDIAGVAWVEDPKPYITRGPSGIGVRSILEWVRSY